MEINKPKIAKVEEPKIEQPSQNCGCWKCKNHSSNYLNASGAAIEAAAKEQTTSNTLAHQTNIILVVSALFIATALIMSKR